MNSLYERVRVLFDPDAPEDDVNSVMTQDEWDAYSLLSIAYNAFVKLPILFHRDEPEFAFHINALKNIVMSRPVERELLSVYDRQAEQPVSHDNGG